MGHLLEKAEALSQKYTAGNLCGIIVEIAREIEKLQPKEEVEETNSPKKEETHKKKK